MNSRRQFLATAPLGLMTALAACQAGNGEETATVSQAGAAPPQPGAPVPERRCSSHSSMNGMVASAIRAAEPRHAHTETD